MSYLMIGAVVAVGIAIWVCNLLHRRVHHFDSWSREHIENLPISFVELNDHWQIVRYNRVTSNQVKTIRRKKLFTEDNPVNQKLARALLEKCGFNVDPVFDGRQAIEKWRENKYDLILMDVQMPNHSGIEVARIIRREEPDNKSSIPIIAMTAGVSPEDIEQIRKAGINDYIAKPVFPAKLQDCLAKFVAPINQVQSDSPAP